MKTEGFGFFGEGPSAVETVCCGTGAFSAEGGTIGAPAADTGHTWAVFVTEAGCLSTKGWPAAGEREALGVVVPVVWLKMTWISRAPFFASCLTRLAGGEGSTTGSASWRGRLISMALPAGLSFWATTDFFPVTAAATASVFLKGRLPKKTKTIQ
ncbi:hypothetical protein ACFX1T_025484 [Malus domestica]